MKNHKQIVTKKRKMKNHKQIVLVEFNNSCPAIIEVISNKPITIEAVAKHFIETEDFNEERDSLTFIEHPTKLTL